MAVWLLSGWIRDNQKGTTLVRPSRYISRFLGAWLHDKIQACWIAIYCVVMMKGLKQVDYVHIPPTGGQRGVKMVTGALTPLNGHACHCWGWSIRVTVLPALMTHCSASLTLFRQYQPILEPVYPTLQVSTAFRGFTQNQFQSWPNDVFSYWSGNHNVTHGYICAYASWIRIDS